MVRWLWAGWATGCLSASAPMQEAPSAVAPEAELAASEDDGDLRDGSFTIIGGNGDGRRAAKDAATGTVDPGAVATAPIDAEPAEPPPVRSWFPESFLWEPRVETGDDGVADVAVRVPDTLTTWRVVALAHDRSGHQAGAEHRFDGTLPVYVEPVLPGWLFAGDRLVLPVQAVNTTSEPVSARLTVSAAGAMAGAAEAEVLLPPGGSAVRSLPFDVTGAGAAVVTASLAAAGVADAAEREVPVRPTGRPVERAAGGTLTDRRTLVLDAPAGADPSTEQVEVLVFPGPLAVLQAELERVAGGGDGAYLFALSTEVGAMADALGVELPRDAARRVQLLAWQDVARRSLGADGAVAADLLLGLRRVDGHPLAAARRDALVDVLLRSQRADGSFSRVATSTQQRVQVETALAAMVLPDDALGPRLRARGALERMGRFDDPYTAAVCAASGVLGADAAAEARAMVAAALVEVDGQRVLPVPDGVVNAWGRRPSPAETLAVAALAVAGDAATRDLAGDLVAQLMQGWSASAGFGAGPLDPLALDAVVRALPATADPVTVSLWVDGEERARAPLDPQQPKVPAALRAAPGAALELRADPPVAGLAFVATRRSWVAWTDADTLPGVDLDVTVGPMAVGRSGVLTVTLAAPRDVSVTVEIGLPPGAVVDGTADGLAAQRVHPDRLTFTTRPFGAGEVLELSWPVTPGFAGRFHTAPLRVEAAGRSAWIQPEVWTVGS